VPEVVPRRGVGEGRPEPALRLRGLRKTFPGTLALVGIDLDLRPGEIHALVGGNGSGKSTLIKILAGVHQGDHGGTIDVSGGASASTGEWSPRRAFAAGLRFVHQNPGIFLDLTVAENVAIGAGFPTGAGGRIVWADLRSRTRDLIERYHLRAGPEQPLRSLRPADRTMVAIARALRDHERNRNGILVLDEPTTSLPAEDVGFLLSALRRYAVDGLTILYVSHRIDEVLSLADRVSVLRDGELVGTVVAAATSEADVVSMIAGRRLEAGQGRDHAVTGGEPVLEARSLTGGPLRGVDLVLHRGEVLGIAGLLGAGQSELLRMLFGALPFDAGELLVDGRPRRFRHPSEAMAAGLGYVPSERAAEALFPGMTVRENVSAGSMAGYYRGLRLRHAAESRDAVAAMRDFLIRAPSDRAPAFTLSGGNQQKMVLARWLRRRPRVLLLDEPTQGVDVGSRQEIYSLLHRAAAASTAAILVSSDFGELERLCHRVAVMRHGRLVAEQRAPDIDEHRLTELAHLSGEAA
jgi:ribose transport system ATP-binding protein